MNAFLEVLSNEIKKIKKTLTTTGSDYTATVTRVDGNTAYVQISGSEIADTPVSMTINASVGDKVRVRVAAGKAWITGNDTAPPADNKKVIELIENNSQGLIETEAKYSRIDQSIDEITIEVGEKMDADMSNRASSIAVNSGQIAFNSNSLVVNSSKFTLDQNGNATFSGTLAAASGFFSGYISVLYQDLWSVHICKDTDPHPIYLYSTTVLNYYSWLDLGNLGFKHGSNEAYMDATGVHTSSDIRLKEDITKIDPETAKHLLPVKFRFKGGEKFHYGFIAQDVQKVMPDTVLEGEDGYLSLTYHELIAPLYALVQEQEDRINQLEERLKQLERR